jgi:hypothetical protein
MEPRQEIQASKGSYSWDHQSILIVLFITESNQQRSNVLGGISNNPIHCDISYTEDSVLFIRSDALKC